MGPRNPRRKQPGIGTQEPANKQTGIGTQESVNKQPGIGTPEPVKRKEKCKVRVSTFDTQNLRKETDRMRRRNRLRPFGSGRHPGGKACWKLFCLERGVQRDEQIPVTRPLMEETMRSTLSSPQQARESTFHVPRAVFVDFELYGLSTSAISFNRTTEVSFVVACCPCAKARGYKPRRGEEFPPLFEHSQCTIRSKRTARS